MTRKKKAAFLLVTCLAGLIAFELAWRIVFAFKVGPSVLLYGTHLERRQIDTAKPGGRTAILHENALGNYSKYFPNQARSDYDSATGETFQVLINSRGFRGREFAEQKAPGVVRVVTLGASSTFGYYNRDDQTYPYHLSQILNERCSGDQSFEVINLGIPHLPSNQIRSLFLAEALPLNPDVVTFYEGINDSYYDGPMDRAVTQPMPTLSARLQRSTVLHALRERLISVEMIGNFLLERFAMYSQEDLDAHTSGKSDYFLNNLSRIGEACDERNIVFVVGSQQARSLLIPREVSSKVTYADEARFVRKRLSEKGRIPLNAYYFLTHALLMKDLATWASRTNTPFVDVIQATDRDRDVLLTAVHLNPRGNRMVAAAFAEEILAHTCPASPSG